MINLERILIEKGGSDGSIYLASAGWKQQGIQPGVQYQPTIIQPGHVIQGFRSQRHASNGHTTNSYNPIYLAEFTDLNNSNIFAYVDAKELHLDWKKMSDKRIQYFTREMNSLNGIEINIKNPQPYPNGLSLGQFDYDELRYYLGI